MKYVDYHLHTHVSHDAAGMILEHARQAEKAGLSELCFTEHLDFYPSDDGLSCSTIPSKPTGGYRRLRSGATNRCCATGRVSWITSPRWTVGCELLQSSADFLLGSVHNVDALESQIAKAGSTRQRGLAGLRTTTDSGAAVGTVFDSFAST